MLNTVYIMYVIYIFYEMVNLLVPNSVIVTKKYFNPGCLQNAINWWRCCCISWNSVCAFNNTTSIYHVTCVNWEQDYSNARSLEMF